MAGTTPRGYPYPHDLDPINVAVDIELLAEAIDADITESLEGIGAEQDAAQNAAIAALQSSLTSNYNQDAVDRARMETIAQQLYDALVANNANDAAQQGSINALQSTVNKLYGVQTILARDVPVTLDGNGMARIPLHTGGVQIFATAPVVTASHNNLQGGVNGLFWVDIKVGAVGNIEFLIQAAEAQTGNLYINASIIVSFIAVGTRV